MFEVDPAAPTVETPQLRIYSIGHSNHSLDRFLELLAQHEIDVIADVRSAPWSKYVAWSNQPVLRKELRQRGVRYVFMGEQLGGKPMGDDYEGVADRQELYRRIAASASFQEGIDRLSYGASQHRVAMLCSEENPVVCHRHLLITPHLNERGVAVDHIRGNGAVEPAHLTQVAAPQQLPLL
jgi:uncharacterized protein (DUF488 family)